MYEYERPGRWGRFFFFLRFEALFTFSFLRLQDLRLKMIPANPTIAPYIFFRVRVGLAPIISFPLDSKCFNTLVDGIQRKEKRRSNRGVYVYIKEGKGTETDGVPRQGKEREKEG